MNSLQAETDVQNRFVQFVDVLGVGECWLWNARSKHPYGYGSFSMKNPYGAWRGYCSHRAVWLLFVGPIPEGLHVRHKCDNPPCCNPNHLELGTHQQNMQDRADRGTHPFSKATHCRNGHEWTIENTHYYPAGTNHKRCKTCSRLGPKRLEKAAGVQESTAPWLNAAVHALVAQGHVEITEGSRW